MVTTLLLFALVLIAVSLILIAVFQRRLIYRRGGRSVSSGMSLESIGGEFLEIETSDGERLEAWYKSPAEGQPIVIFFHGSADSPDQRAVRFLALLSAQFGVLAPHFRGYGRSTGVPSEQGLQLDAEAAYRFCKMRYRPEQIVLWGFSLGSAVAVALASKRKIAALVLEAAFTSLTDVAKHWIPFLPVQLFLRDRFQADQAIRSVTTPILMLHGGTDRDVPLALGKRLFENASAPKEFTLLDAGGHDDLDQYGAVAIVRRFLGQQFKSPV